MKKLTYFTSEFVSPGHPDKVSDQISDAVLDACLADDPNSRVACEVFCTTGQVVVGGEITTTTYIDIQDIVRRKIDEIGYREGMGFDSNCGVLNAIHSQSPDIAMGVDIGGAGDQGIMFGGAVKETPELMDPNSRVACEVFCTTGQVVVGGEITTTTYIDIQDIVRRKIDEIGYREGKGFDSNCRVLNAIHSQSPDIAMGVDIGGAGDQGIMFGGAVK